MNREVKIAITAIAILSVVVGFLLFSGRQIMLSPAETDFILFADSNSTIKLNTTVIGGPVSFNLLYTNGTSSFAGLGRGDFHKLVSSESNTIKLNKYTNDWFIASWVNGDEAESVVFQITDIDDSYPDKNTTTLRNLATGTELEFDIGDPRDIRNFLLTLDSANADTGDVELTISTNTNRIENVSYYDYNDSLLLLMNLDNVSAIGENDTKAVDVSKYANNGTISGGPVWTSGKYGGAYTFNGDYYKFIKIYPGTLYKVQPISVSAWVKTSQKGTDSCGYGTIINYENGEADYGWILYVTNGHAGWQWSADIGGPVVKVISNTDISDNNWHYVTLTDDGSTMNMYIDGNLDNASASGTPQWTSPMYTFIGTTRPDCTYCTSCNTGIYHRWELTGSVDDISIWNLTLNANEVKQMYDTGKLEFYTNESVNESIGNVYLDRIYDSKGNYLKLPLESGLPTEVYDFNIVNGNNETIQTYNAWINGDLNTVVNISGIPSECTDSDGGLDYFVKGNVSGYQEVNGNMEAYNLPDGCHNSSSLVEFYCEGNNPRGTGVISCPNGCADGRCLMQFTGESTNLSLVAGDMAANLVLETPYGKIQFIGDVNVSRIKNNLALLESSVTIVHMRIEVNTTILPELENIPAIITFKNVSLRNPQILHNSASCPSNKCSSMSYNSTARTLTVNIIGFSEFEVVEGPYCGDGSCRSEETCSNCVADCGLCPSIRGGGSTGICVPKWNCTWGPCFNGQQRYVCAKTNACALNTGKPAEQTKVCLVESNCIDQDGDGYGVGPDCLGPDVNDNDPGTTIEMPTPMPTAPAGVSPYIGIIIWLLTVTIIIALSIIIAVNIRRTRAEKELWEKAKNIIAEMRARGYSDDKIRESFREKGWSDEKISSLIG